MRQLFALALVLILGSCSAPAFAECKRCDELGLTSQFNTSRGAYTLEGAVEFCKREAPTCRGFLPATLEATDPLLKRLQVVNTSVNLRIRPSLDISQYGLTEHWAFPVSGKGDCEDYVLEKRRVLINEGVPAGALRLVIVEDLRNTEGHALLGVVTDRGLYLLDNQSMKIETPFSTPHYNYLAIQTPQKFDRFERITGVRL